MSDGIILDRTCESGSDDPIRRRMDMACAKPAVGDVRRRDTKRTILVCAECLAAFERDVEHVRDLNRSHLGVEQIGPAYEVHRW